MDEKKLKAQAKALKPVVRIGKQGMTDTQVEEIQKNLKTQGLVKIKLLKSALDVMPKKEFAQAIVAKTKSRLIDHTGFVITVYKPIPLNTKKR
jgi:RNA-binding protein